MWTVYDDKEILFVVRTVMEEMIRTGRAQTQTEAWNIERKALKGSLDQPAPLVERRGNQTTLMR